MIHSRIWAKVKLDVTGNSALLPVILLQRDGRLTVLEPLLRYFVSCHHRRSHSWMAKLCQIVGQLLDYMHANFQVYEKPVQLFEGFVSAAYNGTFDEQSQDPSGLCWLPSSAATINPKLYSLQEFSDWMVQEGYLPDSLNSWRAATNAEQRFNWIAWYRRNEYAFLGHLGASVGERVELTQARMVKLRRQPMGTDSLVKAFPAEFEMRLLREGFIRPGKDGERDILSKFDWRGICISMLLLYGARRPSEPFHLWVGDVMENPTRPGEALVRIYDPVEGAAPDYPKINGRRAPNRQAYLQAFHPRYPPRNIGVGNYHAGFKGRAFADDKEKFIHVHWLPSYVGEAFLWAYHNYMQQRARLRIDGSRHPFAFVSHHGKYKGEPYSISSFETAWDRALRRIGLPNSKANGTSPHGGRHAAGHRANRAGLSQFEAQEMFAHSSPDSQLVYRVPSPEQITETMDAATLKLQSAHSGEQAPGSVLLSRDWKKIWE